MKYIAQILFASGYLVAFSAAQVYPTIGPDDVDPAIRETWCVNQQAYCPNICMDQERVGASQNDCDPDTLKYTCICEDGKSPNLTEYSLTIPYELCRESIIKCSNNCNGDAACANKCNTGKQCGASDPTRHNATTTTASAGATKTSYSASSTSGSHKASSTSDPFSTGGVASTLANTGPMGFVILAAAGLGFFGLL